MKQKTLISVLIICMMGIWFSGCQDVNRPSAKNPVTLTMWHNYGGEMQKTMDELIDEFNSTVGRKKGFVINVTAISSGAELNESLAMIANGDPGAPKMPDIRTAYPKIAIQFQQKDLLVNMDHHFNENDLSAYIPEFIGEGRIGDDGLYVFPIAKSTEVLYLNQTLFDRFAAATGVNREQLSTFEGIAKLSVAYYEWTDGQTPDIPNDGKQFFTSDSWFNVAQVGMIQMGGNLFEGEKPILSGERYTHIFNTLYVPAIKGGIVMYNGYSSDLSKTGDIVCSTGSSAGFLFYGDTITHPDNTIEQVEYNILPYPVFEGGKKTAIQRGGGLIIAKSEEKKEYAAAVFIKWLTAPAQNMRFVSSTGYLPVTKQAFEKDIKEYIAGEANSRVKKMLTTVTSMYENYTFFTAPTFAEFDNISKSYEKKFKSIMLSQRDAFLKNEDISSDAAIVQMQRNIVN